MEMWNFASIDADLEKITFTNEFQTAHAQIHPNSIEVWYHWDGYTRSVPLSTLLECYEENVLRETSTMDGKLK